MDYIAYLQSLKPEDWSKMATSKWTVKDVLAHLVGWEREVAQTFTDAWKNGKQPWFMITENYDDFNAKIKEEFTAWSPEELLTEWQKWEKNLDDKIKEIGKDNFDVRKEAFTWVTDEGEQSHYLHHINQIKKAVSR